MKCLNLVNTLIPIALSAVSAGAVVRAAFGIEAAVWSRLAFKLGGAIFAMFAAGQHALLVVADTLATAADALAALTTFLN